MLLRTSKRLNGVSWPFQVLALSRFEDARPVPRVIYNMAPCGDWCCAAASLGLLALSDLLIVAPVHGATILVLIVLTGSVLRLMPGHFLLSWVLCRSCELLQAFCFLNLCGFGIALGFCTSRCSPCVRSPLSGSCKVFGARFPWQMCKYALARVPFQGSLWIAL